MTHDNIKPNVILIGAQKCGTTSLYNWIAQHPEVYGHPGMKDYNFFAKDELYEGLGIDWFKKQFKTKSKIVLHGSVTYAYFQKAAPRIHNFNPNVKIIMVVRNPAERARSAFYDLIKIGQVDKTSFEKIIAESQEIIYKGKSQLEDSFMLNVLEQGDYFSQINEYSKYFSAKQIKLISFEGLTDNPSDTMKDVFKFLGVADTFLPNFKRINESGEPRSKLFLKVIQSIKIPTRIKRFLPVASITKFKVYLIRGLNSKPIKKDPMNPETRDFLNSFYKEQNIKLYKTYGVNISDWK